MSEMLIKKKPLIHIGEDVKPEIRAALEAWMASLPEDHAERVSAMRGSFAHVNTSADDFARRKQEEIDVEEAKFRR